MTGTNASKHWLFATFASLFSSLRASSRCLPSFALRRRLLGQRRRSFRTPGCRSGVDLDNLGAKKDYEEMLAKKWRLGTDEDALVLRLNVQANFPEQRCAQDRPLSGHNSHAQSARWINFGSFAKACHGKSFYSVFLFFLEQQWAHKYYSLTKNQERTTLPSTTSNRQRARVKRKNVCKSKAWRDGANLKAHFSSRAFPREISVRGRFFRTSFSTTFRWRIFLKPTGID